MWHQLWIPVLIPTLIIKSDCVDNNNTDTVFIRSGGHADVERAYQERTTAKTATEGTAATAGTTTVHAKETEPSTTKFYEDATDSVVFVPNNSPPRDEDEYDGRGLRVKDVLMMKTVHDAMDNNFHVEKKDESPNEDTVFVQGKNNDYEKSDLEDKTRRRNNNDYQNYNRMEEITEDKIIAKPKLNCRNLDCNNTINSVCGAKFINNEWRYRLFLNDCYFRKVNCGFKYEINRYKEVELDRCKNIGAHFAEMPFYYKPRRPNMNKPELKLQDTRRSSSSRRSMAMNINGDFCSHACPVTCTEDYDPQCAISITGHKRVFLNHCKLDLNSCSYGVVWQKKSLSECVGHKKADLRENRGFIGWMQRVGIVDSRGRLVLE